MESCGRDAMADAVESIRMLAVEVVRIALAKERPDRFERSEWWSAVSGRSAVSEWSVMSEEACEAQRRKDAEREGL